MKQLCDEVDIDRRPDGTTVTMRLRLDAQVPPVNRARA